MENCSSWPGITPTMFCTAFHPNPKPFSITCVNAHMTLHYLQMSVRSPNKTLSIECCSVTSLTVFNVLLLFGLYLYNYNHFIFFSLFILCYVACAFVICLLKYLLTYLLSLQLSPDPQLAAHSVKLYTFFGLLGNSDGCLCKHDMQ